MYIQSEPLRLWVKGTQVASAVAEGNGNGLGACRAHGVHAHTLSLPIAGSVAAFAGSNRAAADPSGLELAAGSRTPPQPDSQAVGSAAQEVPLCSSPCWYTFPTGKDGHPRTHSTDLIAASHTHKPCITLLS